MPKQEKWERIYEEYKKENNVSIEELEKEWKAKDNEYRIQLTQIEDSNSEEYKKINSEKRKAKKEFNNKKNSISKFSSIKKNESKIEKTKEHRDIHQVLLDKVLSFRAENEKREKDIAKLEKEAIKLEKELEELKYIEEHLNIALKNTGLSDERRTEIASRKKENIEKQNKNSEAFSKNQKALQEKLKTPIKEYLEEDIDYFKDMIEKDNKICELLVEGKTMGEIQETLKTQKDTKKQPEKTVVEKEEVKETPEATTSLGGGRK